ncbi:hypothetical protein [Scytonema sp. PCC 10023]|uniref:hypothetical protein n=1 Tax=Scytonema sp. PCC 10023 TaxID=1680591 RepID=UPI0039C5BC27
MYQTCHGTSGTRVIVEEIFLSPSVLTLARQSPGSGKPNGRANHCQFGNPPAVALDSPSFALAPQLVGTRTFP